MFVVNLLRFDTDVRDVSARKPNFCVSAVLEGCWAGMGVGTAPVLAFAAAVFVHLLLLSFLSFQRLAMAHNLRFLPDIPNSVSCSRGKSGEKTILPAMALERRKRLEKALERP